ncbi:uncharacterized protein LOC119579094 [Penaeus monodon]|uniref:uncharacterized protein LOC119579094 n=1 Tax=Penaeus monodon TaxID=6687 RepID=UPI0018A75790|nr:uncharacterized protein LOC119579094 [Penaeus monodon]
MRKLLPFALASPGWKLQARRLQALNTIRLPAPSLSHPTAQARAVVPDDGALHSHTGVQLRLTCRVDLATEPVSHFFWYHNGTGINFSKTRSLTIVTHGYCSYVVIENVTWEDSGVYTCAPLRARPANLTLHVLQGERGRGTRRVEGFSRLPFSLFCSHVPPSLVADEQRSALHNGRGDKDFARAAATASVLLLAPPSWLLLTCLVGARPSC